MNKYVKINDNKEIVIDKEVLFMLDKLIKHKDFKNYDNRIWFDLGKMERDIKSVVIKLRNKEEDYYE